MKKWLDSFSTNLKAAAGGWHGQPLKKGDEIPFSENSIYFAGLLKEENNFAILPWRVNVGELYRDPHTIGFLPGNEWKRLTPASQKNFLNNQVP